MPDDRELLRDYADGASEAAFTAIAGRHVDMVYSVALRQVRNPDLAREVTQTVFILLARKAKSLPKGVVLSGWLFKATRFAAANALRAQFRQQRRAHHIMEMALINGLEDTDSTWQAISPLLDEGLSKLGETDRQALLIRFYERRDFAEVARVLGIQETAAKKRVARAVEKLRKFFARRGTTISAAALTASVGTFAVQAAPAGLAAAATTASLAQMALAAGALSQGTLKLMAWTKFKITAACAAAALAVSTTVIVQWNAVSRLRAENQKLRQEIESKQRQSAELADLEREQTGQQMAQLRRDAVDLPKLRGEVGLLRKQIDECARLRAENEKLKSQMQLAVEKTQISDQKTAEQKYGLQLVGDLKQWGLAVILFADENKGQMPANFEQVRSFLESKIQFEADHFELVPYQQLRDITKPMDTIVIREKESWRTTSGKWAHGYAFADGHSEIHSEESPEAMRRWEKARLVQNPAP